MSLVSPMSSMLMGRNRASDAEFNMFRSADQIYSGIRQVGNTPRFSANNLKSLHNREKNLMANMLTSNLMRKIHNSQAESIEKILKENIKKSFSYYA